MLCECCQEREATIHLSQVIDQDAREVHLCATCAEQHGLNLQSAISLPEMLLNLAVGKPPGAGFSATPEKRCSQCHLRAGDFKKNGRLGCPSCYESFAEELLQLLADMQCGPTHKGKQPRHAPPPPQPAPASASDPVHKNQPRRTPKTTSAAPTAAAIPSPNTSSASPNLMAPRKALERQLAEAIRAENYEEAARLRDALQQQGKPNA